MNIALFASGSSGNCALVSDGETHILIDAGISARRICAGLTAQDVAPADLAGVLVTHEHSDHVKGLAVLLRRDPTAVYALPAVCAALRKLLELVQAAYCANLKIILKIHPQNFS